MFKNDNKKGNEVAVIQQLLQDENDVFDMTIIALERIETILIEEKGYQLVKTSMATERDLHKKQRSISGAFEELKLQCTSLKMCSSYEDKEIFEMAVGLFMKNILEWYAGREKLDFFDEVDCAIIPILYSLTNRDLLDVHSVFEKYVYKTPTNDLSLNDKYEETRSGVEAWILAQDYVSKMQHADRNYGDNDSTNIVFSHKRGELINGYVRIMKALTAMFYISAPAKMVFNMVKEYLPEVIASVPHINEEFIDNFFEKKIQESAESNPGTESAESNPGTESTESNPETEYAESNPETESAESNPETESTVSNPETEEPEKVKNKYDEEVMKPILIEALKQILDKENVEYNEIIIEVK